MDRLSLVVIHRFHPSIGGPGDDEIPYFQCAVLNQNGSARTPLTVQFSFDHNAVGRFIGIGFKFANLCYQQQALQKVVDAVSGLG